MWSKGVYVNKTMLINCLIISYKKIVVEKVIQPNLYVKVTQVNLEMWSVLVVVLYMSNYEFLFN
jgi:hypothetical protein